MERGRGSKREFSHVTTNSGCMHLQSPHRQFLPSAHAVPSLLSPNQIPIDQCPQPHPPPHTSYPSIGKHHWSIVKYDPQMLLAGTQSCPWLT
eukprot:1152880-Pelagomonas_calceolata.AAC.3